MKKGLQEVEQKQQRLVQTLLDQPHYWWRRRQSHRLINQKVALLSARNAPINTPRVDLLGSGRIWRGLATIPR